MNIIAHLDSLLDPTKLNPGVESHAFAGLLEHIIGEFIKALDRPANIFVLFWNRICIAEPLESGSDILTGWITAFCVRYTDGRWQGSSPSITAYSDAFD